MKNWHVLYIHLILNLYVTALLTQCNFGELLFKKNRAILLRQNLYVNMSFLSENKMKINSVLFPYRSSAITSATPRRIPSLTECPHSRMPSTERMNHTVR
jgi:hypothetical protein